MKPIYTLTFLFFSTIAISQDTIDSPKLEYELVDKYGDGIFVEVFDSTIIDDNKYNYNNEVYKVGNGFKYKYQHITRKGEIKYFKVNYAVWDFVPEEQVDSTTIKTVLIEAQDGNPMARNSPDYSQTAITYKLNNIEGFSMSGAIENEANIWIHPPRDNYFRILELNPFPYIKAPFEIGTNWKWRLKIGSGWGDERWRTWQGIIENLYEYEITDRCKIKTELGDIDCYVIESSAQSSIGVTGLTAYFNNKYGFVRLDYLNINGSKTILELIEHTESKSYKK